MTAPSGMRTLSGITPSGSLTLGNYLGALKRFVDRQQSVHRQQSVDKQQSVDRQQSVGRQQSVDDGRDDAGYYFIADLHALTTPQDPARTRDLALETAGLYFAAGLDPDRSTVFLQSHVRAHVELAYLLECTAYVGELGRMIQFKEKGGRPKTRASLFTYPCLMAADILLYDAESVPVGGDQDQHVELARDLAVRFNRSYGDTFVVPTLAKAALAARVADLADPTVKMSKSAPDAAAGVIRMLDPADVIRKKIGRAVTDSDSNVAYDPEHKPGVSNLLDILAAVVGGRPAELAEQYSSYGQLKGACADAVIAELEPIHHRYAELTADPSELERLLALGAQRASAQAEPVLARARSAIGLVTPARVV
jgi:tryptophanyl-tRNA synthetase